mmetsp:Transcript_7521/g.13554  ORF Transcript_7521/g.13554 Transcript_7521/m.13554 type:complete len:243 (+) Transcript_7521:655-1383(+)
MYGGGSQWPRNAKFSLSRNPQSSLSIMEKRRAAEATRKPNLRIPSVNSFRFTRPSLLVSSNANVSSNEPWKSLWMICLNSAKSIADCGSSSRMVTRPLLSLSRYLHSAPVLPLKPISTHARANCFSPIDILPSGSSMNHARTGLPNLWFAKEMKSSKACKPFCIIVRCCAGADSSLLIGAAVDDFEDIIEPSSLRRLVELLLISTKNFIRRKRAATSWLVSTWMSVAGKGALRDSGRGFPVQ